MVFNKDLNKLEIMSLINCHRASLNNNLSIYSRFDSIRLKNNFNHKVIGFIFNIIKFAEDFYICKALNN